MSAITLKAAGSLLASAGVASAAMAMVPGVALAATDCGSGTEVSAGICEQAFTTAGDFTFTAPSGVTKVSAIIIGGGGGAEYNAGGAYGGGGGEVVYLDSVSTSSALQITVGSGGAADPDIEGTGNGGGSSSIGTDEAAGGDGGSYYSERGGDSGNGNAGSGGYSNVVFFYTGAGAGQGGDAPDCISGANADTCPAGPGVTASSIAMNSALFPEVLGEPEYGTGGVGVEVSNTSVGDHAAGHGGDATTITSGDDGNDGAVILRWGALPDTGLSVQPWMVGTGVATVAAGAIFASGLLRTRRQGRHSA
jgi:hypothetical protein